jgi:hypothetical protein
MGILRSRLRGLAVTWLLLQVAWVTALVPRDCCAAHRPAAKGCHESVSATHCPMRAADGTPCPMHRGHGGHNSAEASPEHHHGSAPAERHTTAATQRDYPAQAPADCRLTAGCDGPLAALFALLSNHGILPDSAAVSPNVEIRRITTTAPDRLGGRFQPPDPPPPRA